MWTVVQLEFNTGEFKVRIVIIRLYFWNKLLRYKIWKASWCFPWAIRFSHRGRLRFSLGNSTRLVLRYLDFWFTNNWVVIILKCHESVWYYLELRWVSGHCLAPLEAVTMLPFFSFTSRGLGLKGVLNLFCFHCRINTTWPGLMVFSWARAFESA